MNENPLADHPLLQKPKDDVAVIGADFGDIEARAVLSTASRQLGKQEFTAAVVRSAIENCTPPGTKQGGVTSPTAEAATPAPVKYIVPHNIAQADYDRIVASIQKETKLPFEVVRAAMPAVAKEAPLMLRTHQEVMQERRAQEGSRFATQIQRALDVIRAAKRPVKMGFIEHELGTSIFRALEPELNGHPAVQTKRHKNQLYYTWKG